MLQPERALAAVRVVTAAAAAAPEEHLHVGQKIAMYCRTTGNLPDWLTIALISAMPVVELRGGIPVGLWMGLPIAKVFGLCVAGNMVPIPLILLALRSSAVQNVLKPFLDRARSKAKEFGDAEKQAVALLLFVGIPLPGTGAWTGAMIASILGMPVAKSLAAIFAGVVSAGAIMTALTLAGKAGAIAATAVLAIFCVTSITAKNNKAAGQAPPPPAE
ncbi:putative small multi-drug export protein-domain-containing protein [Tribonema minus]|uniref:Putative small multi-drug export protein-domain-containing protein n=1 Tax=Tribonema minus TaxID=303371 RepID=A0A835YGM4_9STRA|nr:putative small multi-drug export protein-domain-containing protein [Tribonema minus]